MKKQIVTSSGIKLYLGYNVCYSYFVDSSNRIELRNIFYISKLDEFAFNYSIPKKLLKIFEGEKLTNELINQLEIHGIVKYEIVKQKICEYQNLKRKKDLLKEELLLKKFY